jgi:hypothetical protein
VRTIIKYSTDDQERGTASDNSSFLQLNLLKICKINYRLQRQKRSFIAREKSGNIGTEFNK